MRPERTYVPTCIFTFFKIRLSQRAKAERTLTRALKECHYAATGNRRRILANLVPLRMRMGKLGLLLDHALRRARSFLVLYVEH